MGANGIYGTVVLYNHNKKFQCHCILDQLQFLNALHGQPYEECNLVIQMDGDQVIKGT